MKEHIFKPLYDAALATLTACTDREVRLHYLAAKRWFDWTSPDYEVPNERVAMIEAILGADPIAVEGGAFDFWAHRRIIPRGRLNRWRKQEG